VKNLRQAAKGLGVSAAALALVAGGALLAGGAAIAAGTITSGDIKDQTIQSRDIGEGGVGTSELRNNDVRRGDIKDGAVGPGEILDGSVRAADLDDRLAESLKGEKGDPGPQGPEGPAGPAGPAGEGGADAIVTVNAVTSVSDRNDSGTNGDWAKDTFTRDVTVTRQHAAKAADCGSGATQCWFYTANLVDSGSFMTIEGAKSPAAGVDIAGIVSGTFNGGSRIEFYASSDSPDASLVPATVTGNDLATGDWVKEFFADGTTVTAPDLLNWSWTYTAPATCEQWVNAKAGNEGDITGVNQCGTATE
jgi:hypothetical protein